MSGVAKPIPKESIKIVTICQIFIIVAGVFRYFFIFISVIAIVGEKRGIIGFET